MAKNKNGKGKSKSNGGNGGKSAKKDISLTPLMYLGFILICVTALLQSLIPAFPQALGNILYVIGVLALVVYMIQIAFEKRTGKREADGENVENRLKNRK